MLDPSNGYEAVAARYRASRSRIGAAQVLECAQSLPLGASVLDLGCGHGVPVTEALLLPVAAFTPSTPCRARCLPSASFPDLAVACEAAGTSSFFDRRYDGIVAWGLMFLLTPAAQRSVVANVSRALTPGGTFHDVLASEGLVVREEGDDEGGNHYYVAKKPSA